MSYFSIISRHKAKIIARILSGNRDNYLYLLNMPCFFYHILKAKIITVIHKKAQLKVINLIFYINATKVFLNSQRQ